MKITWTTESGPYGKYTTCTVGALGLEASATFRRPKEALAYALVTLGERITGMPIDQFEAALLLEPQPAPTPLEAAAEDPRSVVIHEQLLAYLDARGYPDALLAAIKHRAEQGREKYGQHLRTFNGRSFRIDRAQEGVDRLFYAFGEALESGHEVPSVRNRRPDDMVPAAWAEVDAIARETLRDVKGGIR